jgi:predicted GIY-YIG superfamily endonuclease
LCIAASMFHVYVIVSDSSAERYYIGFSTRPRERLQEHNSGKNPSTLRTVLGDSLQFLAFFQNNRHAFSSDILKAVQAERF